MIKITTPLLVLFTLLTTNLFSQNKTDFCYGRALLPEVVEQVRKSFPVYTGKDHTAPFLKWEQIVVVPSELVWEEKVNPDCASKKKEDCLMMCSRRTPPQIKNYQIVTDLSATTDFEWREFDYNEVLEASKEEYVTVVCNEKIDETFINQLSNQLSLRGYYQGALHQIFSQKLKNALIRYQKENGYPEGALDLETLASLGFGYVNK